MFKNKDGTMRFHAISINRGMYLRLERLGLSKTDHTEAWLHVADIPVTQSKDGQIDLMASFTEVMDLMGVDDEADLEFFLE